MEANKIAIMGGTFDPIHMGHLIMAEVVIDQCDINTVLFIPSGNPPHKQENDVTDKKHRYLMTQLAINDNNKFFISDIEVNTEKITYTIDTIKKLNKQYGQKLSFIVGADSLLSILNWHKAKDLLKICSFIVINRIGYREEEISCHIEKLTNDYGADIHKINISEINLSSTEIRQRVNTSKSIRYMVPEAVRQYIDNNNLYKNKLTLPLSQINEMNDYVKNVMSAKRYRHTLGVVQSATLLATIHGVDVDKAYIGALFHDVAKEIDPSEMDSINKKNNAGWDNFELETNHLKHGKLGAVLVQRDWKIDDEDILNSIRYHTTGRKNMSDIEKIVYLADAIEIGRGADPSLDFLREICYKDLNRAMYYASVLSKEVVEKKKQTIHPIIDELISEYKIYK
ncbi:MAG: nicotinate (nicotinamide) nucleotide adenylyltransferase [Epulopiscium sp. Nele67-Bin004]|nr:MAG: nicotinate (nicotinamide) nucleotide adenylyltransferase [Epulopiscium sp. Nele67-Bin004]